MQSKQTDRPDAEWFAEKIHAAYIAHMEQFNHITHQSAHCFKEKKWTEGRALARERLDLYSHFVAQTISEFKARQAVHPECAATNFWVDVKKTYWELIQDRLDLELAETFFNSISRRMFRTTGVNTKIEFTLEEFRPPDIEDRYCPVCDLYRSSGATYFKIEIIRDIFEHYQKMFDFSNMERDIQQTAETMEKLLVSVSGGLRMRYIEMVSSVFYRGRAAYLVGRIRNGAHPIPLVIALLHDDDGIRVDTVLMGEADISVLFSFTRSYFHVMVPYPTELVNFLKTILTRKRISEIYISLGFYKHGKSELFREVVRTLRSAEQQFQFAFGEPGMVMAVFTIPALNVVFKVIKDKFDFPKKANADLVRSKYQLVFYHDRAGRMVDAQEFSQLKFAKRLFHESLLTSLRQDVGQNMIETRDHIVIRHVYLERRVTPLDVYLRTARKKDAVAAVIDYGQAIKDLAAGNIFPGDLFIKNFGVTRHGRVVFYDYDEISMLTECRFRKLPQPRNDQEAMSDEPWYHVAEHDVFPEEFRTFLTFPGSLKIEFERRHGDLFHVDFWRAIQQKLEKGIYVHIFPYDVKKRFYIPENIF